MESDLEPDGPARPRRACRLLLEANGVLEQMAARVNRSPVRRDRASGGEERPCRILLSRQLRFPHRTRIF